jgi:hypothetical protein
MRSQVLLRVLAVVFLTAAAFLTVSAAAPPVLAQASTTTPPASSHCKDCRWIESQIQDIDDRIASWERQTASLNKYGDPHDPGIQNALKDIANKIATLKAKRADLVRQKADCQKKCPAPASQSGVDKPPPPPPPCPNGETCKPSDDGCHGSGCPERHCTGPQCGPCTPGPDCKPPDDSCHDHGCPPHCTSEPRCTSGGANDCRNHEVYVDISECAQNNGCPQGPQGPQGKPASCNGTACPSGHDQCQTPPCTPKDAGPKGPGGASTCPKDAKPRTHRGFYFGVDVGAHGSRATGKDQPQTQPNQQQPTTPH